MKEATGEANLTVITIILIGTILPTFYLIIPRMLNSTKDKSCCISNNGTIEGTNCVIVSGKKKESNTKYNDITTSYPLSGFNQRCR